MVNKRLLHGLNVPSSWAAFNRAQLCTVGEDGELRRGT